MNISGAPVFFHAPHRVLAEFVHLPGAANLILLAALGWLAAFGVWYARFAPIYLNPRPDGRPG